MIDTPMSREVLITIAHQIVVNQNDHRKLKLIIIF